MKISDVRVAHKERGHDRPVRDALQTLAGGGSTEVSILADSAAEGHGVISFGRIDGAPRALAVLVEEVVRPVLVGRDATNIIGLLEDLKREMEYFGLSGLTRFAIAAVDMALWHLYGKPSGSKQEPPKTDRAVLGRMNIDLPGFSRCKFPSEYVFRGDRVSPLAQPRRGQPAPPPPGPAREPIEKRRGPDSDVHEGTSIEGLGIEGLWWKIIVHTELGDLQATEGLPVEPRFYAKQLDFGPVRGVEPTPARYLPAPRVAPPSKCR
jgi:Mandelate racemase / muconate lactonizing enzyme, N-terminal domain